MVCTLVTNLYIMLYYFIAETEEFDVNKLVNEWSKFIYNQKKMNKVVHF